MINANKFISAVADRGYDFVSGVPCSFLSPLINSIINEERVPYVGATSEGEAIAIAAGAWLAGRKCLVMCQNSGLGNMVNPLSSLNWTFRIPTLLVVTWRGQPGVKDEPQHELMGEITSQILDTLRVTHQGFPDSEDRINRVLDEIGAEMEASQLPCALVMEGGAVTSEPLRKAASRRDRPPGQYTDVGDVGVLATRFSGLSHILELVPDDVAIIATTGKCGRELYTLADRPQHLYMVGAMGSASGVALGVALNTTKRVIVLDGDGAALMRLGTLATIGGYCPENLIHIVMDNGVHDSTGGQATVSSTVDFAGVAIACGYARAWIGDDLESFGRELTEALATSGPTMLHLRIRSGSAEALGRPGIAPPDVARRFRDFITT